jgi:hypothetical protein
MIRKSGYRFSEKIMRKPGSITTNVHAENSWATAGPNDAHLRLWIPALARTTLDSWERWSLKSDQRSEAVRSTNDVVASVAVAEPVKRSQVIPIIGSSENTIVIAACGLTK